MNVNEALTLSERLQDIVRRSKLYGYSADRLHYEIIYIAEDLKEYADELDESLYAEYLAGIHGIENTLGK